VTLAHWTTLAACRGKDTGLWYPPGETLGHHVKPERWDEPRRICHACPVREKCLEFALATEGYNGIGMWGGTTPRERIRILRLRRRGAA
jgi:WhiB family redox-sensing transcriptional regulator